MHAQCAAILYCRISGRRCPRTVDHRNRQLAQPDVLLLRLPGGVELGDDVVVEVVDVERRGRGRRARLRHRARRQPALRVVAVGRPVRRRTRLVGLGEAALLVVLEGQPQRPRTAVGDRSIDNKVRLFIACIYDFSVSDVEIIFSEKSDNVRDSYCNI